LNICRLKSKVPAKKSQDFCQWLKASRTGPLEPKFETGLYLVWKKDQRLTKQAKLFLERFKQIVMPKESSKQ
jgi:hypothetical protein